MIDLDLLESFISVAEHGSFSAAAKSLLKSQPLLSYQIKQLEIYLGVQLFDRSKYRAVLSDEGQYFYQKSLNLMEHAKEFEKSRLSINDKQELQVSISVSSLYPMEKFSKKLKTIQSKFPDCNFLVSIDTLSGLSKVKENQVDFAIIEQQDPDILLEIDNSDTVGMTVVMATGKIKKQKKYISLKDLMPYPQIILKSSGQHPVKDHGIMKLAKKWVVTDIHSKKSLIQNGFGWGSLPNHLIKHELKNKLLEELCINEMPARTVQLKKASHKNKIKGPVLRLLWDVF